MQDLEYGVNAAGPGSRWTWNAFRARDGLGWQLQIIFFLAVAATFIWRRPDAINHAQFWAEDGAVWYSNAWDFGPFRSLILEYAGYFQTLPRLVAAITLLFPFLYAPFIMNVFGLILQVLPASFLVSARCAAWTSLPVRMAFAIAYVVLPNSKEVDACITNAQWHVALLACFIVVAARPARLGWWIFDISTLLLSGLTGPFCIVLLPVAAFYAWVRRERWRIVPTAVVAGCALIQVIALFEFAATRTHMPLGATPTLFMKLLGGQVYMGALVGENTYSLRPEALPLEVMCVVGTALIIYTAIKARLELKLILAFCMMLFLAELKSPLVSLTEPQWEAMRFFPGARYWFFPMLAFVWSIVWCAMSDRSRFLAGFCTAGLFTMLYGIYSNWEYPPFANEHFSHYVRELNNGPEGHMVIIPLIPGGWTMRIAKKGPHCQTLPIGYIDTPKDNDKVNGVMRVDGWAAGSTPIRRVTISLDGVPVQSVAPDIQRKDADKFPLVAKGGFKGWKTTVDFSKLTPGKHELRARALQENGCDADFNIVSIEKTP